MRVDSLYLPILTALQDLHKHTNIWSLKTWPFQIPKCCAFNCRATVFPESSSFCHGVKVNSNGTMDTLGFLGCMQQKRCLAYLSKDIFIGWNLLDVLLTEIKVEIRATLGILDFRNLSTFWPRHQCRHECDSTNIFPPYYAGDSHFWGKESNRLRLGLLTAAWLGRESTRPSDCPTNITHNGER